jgi:hypothetical protein
LRRGALPSCCGARGERDVNTEVLGWQMTELAGNIHETSNTAQATRTLLQGWVGELRPHASQPWCRHCAGPCSGPATGARGLRPKVVRGCSALCKIRGCGEGCPAQGRLCAAVAGLVKRQVPLPAADTEPPKRAAFPDRSVTPATLTLVRHAAARPRRPRRQNGGECRRGREEGARAAGQRGSREAGAVSAGRQAGR